jgi:hypothetical protein
MSDLDALIDRLAAETRPVKPGLVWRTLLLAAFGGIVLAAVGNFAIGLNPDLGSAATSPIFWTKIGYGTTLAAVALAALAVLVRPERPVPGLLRLAAVPVAVLAMLGIAEAARLPAGTARTAWLGTTWFVCPVLIALLALPAAAMLVWTARQFAPTRLRATGAVIGLASGAVSAALYALHCPENGASFVATWYTLGIAFVGALGFAAGPRLLRW